MRQFSMPPEEKLVNCEHLLDISVIGSCCVSYVCMYTVHVHVQYTCVCTLYMCMYTIHVYVQ